MKQYDSIAFCGGGTKGAFHIGMWKALEDTHYADKIVAVSGTSVGALNAVLFALKDYGNAKRIWCSITPKQFLKLEEDGDGLFSREGLEDIIHSLDLSKLKMDVFVNIYNVDSQKPESYRLNNNSPSRQVELLLASSAFPVVYKPQPIGDHKYFDGGVNRAANIPIEPLYRNGYRNIIIAALDFKFNQYNMCDSDIFNNPLKKIDINQKYVGINFKPIIPLENLGGTFDFDKYKIRDKIIIGYKDSIKQLREEDTYIMKNNFSKKNIQIQNKMRQLFKSADEIEDFIKVTNFSEINLAMETLGGQIFYENIVDLYGWKVQQHKLLGLQNHYRILDNHNIRRAWVLNPDEIINALEIYEAGQRI